MSTSSWYHDAIIYQLHVKVYRDSNGDGVGDFAGLISKLDYLRDLGITAIWLLPFYPSPLRDDGYDTADYRKVHPNYGDLRDFKRFVKEAKARGLRVITELVLNHTSDQHAWFQRARLASPGSRYRDYYVWSDTNQKYEDTRIIFKDFESSNWTWDPVAGQYYWHRFYSHQPDLNWENPEVVAELYKIVDYWLEMGIDGLRLDAVPYLFEEEGTNCENLPQTHQALKDLRAHVDARFEGEGKMLLAEANMWPDEVVDYFGDGDECHMAFHFPLMPRMFMAIRMEDRFPIIDILDETPEIPDSAQWAIFLRNHDELTLEMVTDEERDYMWRIYAEDPRARINLGIRRRLAPLLGNNRRLIELMNSLLFSMPGTPVIYYGDEIGMGDNIYLGDRDGVRTPMQWSADRNAGFSDANPQKLYLPVVIDPEYHSSSVNVEAHLANPESLLWWTKRTIAMRKRHPALSHGKLEWVPSENRKVLTYLRTTADEQILCVVNLSRYAQFVELDLNKYEGYRPVALNGNVEFPPIGALPYMLTLGPHDFYWFVLEKVAVEQAHPTRSTDLPALKIRRSWTDIVGVDRGQLEAILPAYVKSRRWFRSKSRKIRTVTIAEAVPIGGTKATPAGFLTFCEVEYAEGDPETYVLPLVGVALDASSTEPHELPATAIARLTVGSKQAPYALLDGVTDDNFNTALLEMLLKRKKHNGHKGRLESSTSSALRELRAAGDSQEPMALSVDQSNSTVAFGNRYLIKMFRLLEEGTNPDVEIGRYLTEKAQFVHTPMLGASLEYTPYRGTDGVRAGVPRTVAILQEYVANEGDAFAFTLDSLRRYLDEALAHPDPPPVPTSDILALAREELPALAHETIGHYLEAARMLGSRTAEMHTALAAAGPDSALQPDPVTPMYRRSLYQSMRATTRRSFASMRKLSKQQPELTKVLGMEAELLERFKRILDTGLDDVRIRCHGDYHLGQTLWTGRDFRIIDFEGEPGRTIGERRIKRSALKDVAGMVRSFDYAAYTVVQEGTYAPDDPTRKRVETWLSFWYRWVAATFLKSYLEAAEGHGFLPPEPKDLAIMLDVLLLEKALYELQYEANNRPDWVWIPVRGLTFLLERTT
ncbi:MAG: maltose alpha-D-glucosyltransferase [Thermoleophilia bacterium]|nr:maltose alpha-D-glucosyltransferase [Thermoleophilia bacterium]